MNRVDRLIGIVTSLQSRRYVTAEKLSAKFGISIRTVYRDIRALSVLTHSFRERSALLDFLAGLTQSKVTDIHIVRKGDKEWTMRVREIDRIANRKSTHPGASLYDLYW